MQVYNGNKSLDNATLQVVRSGGLAKGTAGNPPVFKEAFRPSVVARHILPGETVYYRFDLSNAEKIPSDFQLHLTAYPNPFNPSTTIRFNLVSAGNVTLTVYDITGRRVQTLVANHLEAGLHTIPGMAQPARRGFILYGLLHPVSSGHERLFC